MSDKSITKNGYQTFADRSKSIPLDVSGNNVFDILITGKDIPAVSTVPGFEQGVTDEIDAFMMAFKEHGALLYYLELPLNYHGILFFNGSSAPSFVAFGKPFPDKADSFPAAGQG